MEHKEGPNGINLEFVMNYPLFALGKMGFEASGLKSDFWECEEKPEK